ncbi:MAG: trehalose-6-phosphate synthase, partial [Novosphingobium sp.]
VNPFSPDDVAHAIRVAMEMPLDERKRRWQALNHTVREENVIVWTEQFTHDLADFQPV